MDLRTSQHSGSPNAPIVEIVERAEAEQPSARAKPCATVSVIQISKTFRQHNNAGVENNNPPSLQGGHQQHFIDQLLIEPTYLSGDGSST